VGCFITILRTYSALLAGLARPSSSTKGKSPLKSEEKLHNRGALRKTNQQ